MAEWHYTLFEETLWQLVLVQQPVLGHQLSKKTFLSYTWWSKRTALKPQ